MSFGISFRGIGKTLSVTFLSALTRGTDEGKPVKVSAAQTVALCADGDPVAGVVETIDEKDAAAVVQLDGFVTLPYTGAAPAVGWKQLAANGSGGVKADATAKQTFLVVDVDTTNTTVTFLLNAIKEK